MSLQASIQQLISHIQANPKAAQATFSAETTLLRDVQVKARVREFSFIIDEPQELGGQNAGPNPVELVLASLGACQEIVYSAYASVLGIDLQEVKVKVRGNLDLHGFLGLDDNVPSGFEKIEYEVTLKSNADEQSIAKLTELVEKHCPVLDILTRQIPVTGNVVHVQNELVAG